MRVFHIGLFGLLMVIGSQARSQELVVYKQIDTIKLYLEVHTPDSIEADSAHPAMVFFFGGGWRGGDRGHFLNQAKYLSKRGLVCFLADYRTWNKHQVSPFECLKDAKAAVRFVRKHAVDFNIDPQKIIVSGGSAGGHLAAATAVVSGFNHPDDDLLVSCIPDALVLFNPVFDNGPGGYGYDRVSEAYQRFSPLHNLRVGAPPTLIFLGTEDDLVPVEAAKYYCKVMEKVGSQCELKLYEGEGHGFFNYRNFENYRQTMGETDVFLQSLGYLQELPEVNIE
jgi:acetyl esterase/lipase